MLSSTRKNEVRDYIPSDMDSEFFLVTSNGKPLFVLSSRTEKPLVDAPEIIENVAIYSLDRWELLDVLSGEVKLSPAPEENSNTPNIVDISMSLDVPVELLLKVEGALLEALRELGPKYNIAIESIKAKGYLIQGFTGRNIFVLNAEFSGYSLTEVQSDELVQELERVLGRELGFDVRLHLNGLDIMRTSSLPLVRFTRSPIVPTGGRIIELSLQKKSRKLLKINKKRLEMEVEHLLKEAGVSQEFLSVVKMKKKAVNPTIIEREVVRELPNIKGIGVKWVRAIRTGEGYTIAIGIERSFRNLSDEKIRELFEGVLKRASTSLKTQGIGVEVSKGYVVIENDVY